MTGRRLRPFVAVVIRKEDKNAFRFDKLTQKAQEAVQQAQEIAGQNGHQAVHPLHLLIALSREREGIVRPVLEKCGVQPDR